MFENLDINGNSINDLDGPMDGSDAVTIRWVNQQLKEAKKDRAALISECVQIKKGMTWMEGEYETMIKGLEKKVAKCLPMAGGIMSGTLDMQGHSIVNFP